MRQAYGFVITIKRAQGAGQRLLAFWFRGVAQLVEHWFPKPAVAGSSPSAPALIDRVSWLRLVAHLCAAGFGSCQEDAIRSCEGWPLAEEVQ